ncbi:bis-aminopropyl spermidine synthase family protein [Actinomadura sp. WMMB 499]|uniref:bis-aminopropyl spermidine synthase family protein n=1 Tax=Actinomadura sp. WMMB 499 TaxID=1219491 RepID=UPI00124836A6|nr:bis-aminopropyl spermidine synthase family protein [Actinomadura sp. WMMB 499]QFG20374.1 putative methyltransferase [Actinomadura sp. WMMB 499]
MDEPGTDDSAAPPAVDGMDPVRVHAALALLTDGWRTRAELVRGTAAPRRSIEALLRTVPVERSGDRYRLPPTAGLSALLAAHPSVPADPVGHLLPAHAAAVERLADLIARAPRGRRALDHVSATPETVVRRALFLGARFWLPGSHLLCVGDHDLTSLAVGLIHPHVRTTVVDIDDRILAYIDAEAAKLGLDVRTRWADLRLGLPPSARDHDLAITDPPYTPDGVGLFVARAVEGLRDPATGRVLLAYGAGDLTPALALKVQNALSELNLLSEAIYPDFNRYFGAEAIGSAADLYVLRPTTKTLPAAVARADRFAAAIYTHGPQSIEATAAPDPGPVADLDPDVLVGPWPKDVLPNVPRVRLATWLGKPYAATVRRAAIALPPGLEPALVRVLLATRAERVRVFTTADIAEPAEILAPVYELTARGTHVDAVRRAPSGTLARTLLDRAHGKAANAWRDALTRQGLTKREARGEVARIAPWTQDATVLELPAHRLKSIT